MFVAYDTDGNGFLDAEEITTVLEVLKKSMKQRGMSDRKAIKEAAALVRTLDENKDGKITLQEWMEVGKQTGLVQELLGPNFVEMMEPV